MADEEIQQEQEHHEVQSSSDDIGNEHLEGFSDEDKRMIQLMADIVVNAVLNS